MTHLEFEEAWRFRDGGGEFIEFNASDGDRSFSCKVSREAIEDLHGATPHGPSWLDLFEPLKDRTRRAIEQKYVTGRFEPDGSIFLSSEDVT